MAKFVYKDAYISVAGTDLSAKAKSVSVLDSYDEVDVTTHGDTAHNALPGLKVDEITIEFTQDFGAGSVDSVLSALNGNASGGAIEFRPTSSAVSATNPKWSGTGMLFSYPPMTGSVGDAATTSVTIKSDASGFTRATT